MTVTALERIAKLTFPGGYSKEVMPEIEADRAISIKRERADDGTDVLTIYFVEDE